MTMLRGRDGLLALMLAALILGPSAHAADPAAATEAASASGSAKPKLKEKTVTKQKTKPVQDSAETPAERKSRLQRECRGAVNAGVCSGYAS
jgi:hypothetical protein